MSTLTALARVHAARSGRAEPIATVAHVHVHQRPLVFVPLMLAGEANAPVAAMVGDDRSDPLLLVVAQPRNREQRFAFAAELAGVVVPYLASFAADVEAVAGRGDEIRIQATDAPQVVVPNRGGLGFVRLFGRSTRFRRTDGPYAVKAEVPDLGRWMTFLAERAEYPGSALLVTATDLLGAHWATGQSAAEDQNLAALYGWIDPPPGRTGPEAAAEAENPLVWPPAGPSTDPTFDAEVLAPLIAGGNIAALRHALHGQLRPTWDLVWRALDRMATLPAGGHVAGRWAADRAAYTGFVTYLQEVGLPQPRRDTAVAAAARLNRLERAQAGLAAQRALDDPLVLAEYRLTGEAFAGTVTAIEPDRVVGEGRGRKLRPLLTVATGDPVRLAAGARVTAVHRPGQKGRVVEAGGGEIVLELTGGMGRALVPEPGLLPEPGDAVAFTAFGDEYSRAPVFPVREDTPWTHGGPPEAYEPTDEDAREVWE